MQDLRAMQIVIDDKQERLVTCDLAQRPLGEIVELEGVGELEEERAEPAAWDSAAMRMKICRASSSWEIASSDSRS
jgi:hypothetical protein